MELPPLMLALMLIRIRMHQLTLSKWLSVSPSWEVTSVEGIVVLHSSSVALGPLPLTLFMRTKWEQVIWACEWTLYSDPHPGSTAFSVCITPRAEGRGWRLCGWRRARMLTQSHHRAVLASTPYLPLPVPVPSPLFTPLPPALLRPQAFSAELCLNYLHCLPWAVSVAQCLFASVKLP